MISALCWMQIMHCLNILISLNYIQYIHRDTEFRIFRAGLINMSFQEINELGGLGVRTGTQFGVTYMEMVENRVFLYYIIF